jgi:hypothetical protein
VATAVLHHPLNMPFAPQPPLSRAPVVSKHEARVRPTPPPPRNGMAAVAAATTGISSSTLQTPRHGGAASRPQPLRRRSSLRAKRNSGTYLHSPKTCTSRAIDRSLEGLTKTVQLHMQQLERNEAMGVPSLQLAPLPEQQQQLPKPSTEPRSKSAPAFSTSSLRPVPPATPRAVDDTAGCSGGRRLPWPWHLTDAECAEQEQRQESATRRRWNQWHDLVATARRNPEEYLRRELPYYCHSSRRASWTARACSSTAAATTPVAAMPARLQPLRQAKPQSNTVKSAPARSPGVERGVRAARVMRAG